MDRSETSVCRWCGQKLIFKGQTTCHHCGRPLGQRATDTSESDAAPPVEAPQAQPIETPLTLPPAPPSPVQPTSLWLEPQQPPSPSSTPVRLAHDQQLARDAGRWSAEDARIGREIARSRELSIAREKEIAEKVDGVRTVGAARTILRTWKSDERNLGRSQIPETEYGPDKEDLEGCWSVLGWVKVALVLLALLLVLATRGCSNQPALSCADEFGNPTTCPGQLPFAP